MIFTDPSTQEAVINYINPFWETPQLKSAGPDPRITLGNTISGTTDSDINTASDASGNLIPIFSLAIPVENKGTIHIIPTGRITLHELDGTQLLNVGKEFIKNENGAVISEKVVDYLTINAEGGALLPQANRLYGINWFGFGRESINPDRSISVLFENPGVYYARVARDDSGYIKPWEKLVRVHTVKHLIARVNLSYMNPVTRKLVERNQDIPVTVEYDEIVKTWNTGLIFVGTIGILLFWWITIWRRRRYHYNDHNTLIGEAGSDEIAVLERARAIIFAKEATRAAKISTAITNKTIPKKLTPKTVDTSRIAPIIPSALIKKTAIKKPLAIEKVVSVKKTVAKKTSTTISKEA